MKWFFTIMLAFYIQCWDVKLEEYYDANGPFSTLDSADEAYLAYSESTDCKVEERVDEHDETEESTESDNVR